MPRPLVLALLCIVFAPSWTRAEPGLCQAAIAPVERASGVPDRLMQAMAIMESGRRDGSGSVAAWPWTINVEGVGEWFETKQQAIAAVTAHRARGARSIDVGCMQVNMMHHPDAFASLEEAFDPGVNARYAARFLQQLLAQTGSWPLAVGGYHSLTPEVGGDYAKKVLAIWARPDRSRVGGRAMAARAPEPVVPALSPAVSSAVPSLPSGGRLIAGPGSAAPQITGRGLDSYRSLPTQMAGGGLFRRS